MFFLALLLSLLPLFFAGGVLLFAPLWAKLSGVFRSVPHYRRYKRTTRLATWRLRRASSGYGPKLRNPLLPLAVAPTPSTLTSCAARQRPWHISVTRTCSPKLVAMLVIALLIEPCSAARFPILHSEATINGRPVTILVDTGASYTLFAASLGLAISGTPSLYEGFANAQSMSLGLAPASLSLLGYTKEMSCDVFTTLTRGVDVVLGMDFLESEDFEINTRRGTIRLGQCLAFAARPVPAAPTGAPACLQAFGDVFAEPTSLPPSRPGLDFSIELKPGATLRECRPIHLNDERAALARTYTDAELTKGFIQPSTQPHAAPLFFVTDPATSSRGAAKLRPVINYIPLNSATLPQPAALPKIADLLRNVGPHAKVFSKIDLRMGFNNLRVSSESVPLTAFSTPHGIFEYLVMPFGVMNGPARFQTLMRSILAPLLHKGVLVYLDDILIYANTEEEHELLLQSVFALLRSNSCHVKVSKCEFGAPSVNFLGFVISQGSIHQNESTTAKITESPFPTTLKSAQRFLGVVNYYREFVPKLSDWAQPFTSLSKKDVDASAVLASAAQDPQSLHRRAFSRIVSEIASKRILGIVDPDRPFYLQTDASSSTSRKRKADDAPLSFSAPFAPLGPLTASLAVAKRRKFFGSNYRIRND